MADVASYHKLEREGDASSQGDVHDVEKMSLTIKQRPQSRLSAHLRLVFEVILVAMVVVMGLKITATDSRNGRPDPNDPKRHFGYVDTVFMNDTKFANEEALADPDALHKTLSNWIQLSSKGRGYVSVPESERDGMDGPPYMLNPLHRPIEQEAYMVSDLHQLHCLSTIMLSYAKLRQGGNETDMGFHIAHCFDYLRQGIICAGDATLEGNQSATYPGVEIPWGTSHRCADWSALVEWADERTIWPFPSVMDIL